MSVLCVASGGALGTLLRYLIASFMPSEEFPRYPLSVNLLGCLIMGLFAGRIFKFPVGEEARLFVMTGFLGVLTTFRSVGGKRRIGKDKPLCRVVRYCVRVFVFAAFRAGKTFF